MTEPVVIQVGQWYLIVLVSHDCRVCKALWFDCDTLDMKVDCGRDDNYYVIPEDIAFVLPLSGEGH